PASYILLGIGAFFLLRNLTDFDIGPILWPAFIIGIGLWLLLGKSHSSPRPPGPERHRYRDRSHSGDYEWDKRIVNEQTAPPSGGASPFNEAEEPEVFADSFPSDDYLKSTSIFGDVKKTIISKRFRGGEVVNAFGGTDINLIQTDIQQPVVI